jgi:hypothetical protein
MYVNRTWLAAAGFPAWLADEMDDGDYPPPEKREDKENI